MSDKPWGDFPTWTLAVATVGLFIGAIITAIYAKRSYKELGKQRDQDKTQFQRQLQLAKSQFQLQQAKPSLMGILVLTHRLRSYAKVFLDVRSKYRQWPETTLLSEDDAQLKGAELLAGGYPQFQERLNDLASKIKSFNLLRADRNSYLLEVQVLGPNGIEVFSEGRGENEFEGVHNETMNLLELIDHRCNALEQALLKVFNDLEE